MKKKKQLCWTDGSSSSLSSWLHFYPNRGPALCRMWLNLYISLSDKSSLMDDLYAPSSSLHLRRVVFASPHPHVTHTSEGCCRLEPGRVTDCESADKLPPLIKISAFLVKQFLSFSIKALCQEKTFALGQGWAGRVGWECLTLWVSPVEMHHCSWRKKKFNSNSLDKEDLDTQMRKLFFTSLLINATCLLQHQ